MDLARHWSDPLLSAVPGKRLLSDLNHAEALQHLDISGHRTPVALQFPCQHADRCWRLLDLFEHKYSLLRQDMQESLDVFEGHYSTGRNGIAPARRPR